MATVEVLARVIDRDENRICLFLPSTMGFDWFDCSQIVNIDKLQINDTYIQLVIMEETAFDGSQLDEFPWPNECEFCGS